MNFAKPYWVIYTLRDLMDLNEDDSFPDPPQIENDSTSLSARLLNEFVYCPRLFYYEFVEGIFVHNADTLRGAHIHRRVDSGSGKMPPATTEGTANPSTEAPTAAAAAPDEAELAAARERGEIIHSRSVWLRSDRLNVNAKLDLVETRAPMDAGGRRSAIPVDYKKGAPREGENAIGIWDADRMQLGLQMLILRENGYDCEEGVIYYQQTKQRVRLPWTAELETWIERTVAQARDCAAVPMIPPPLYASPKCPRCSLASVCLPDETTLLARLSAAEQEAAAAANADPAASSATGHSILPPPPSLPPSAVPALSVRRLMAARDERKPLYLNTPGLRVSVKSERLIVKDKEKEIDAVRLRDVSHLALLGNIQISTQAVQTLCELEIPVAYFSMGGWFYGLTRGHGLKNVFTRMAQFARAADPLASLSVAKQFIHGKIKNQRTLLMRNHVEPPDWALLRLKQAAQDIWRAGSAAELLGMEGAAASVYFECFSGMIKVSDGLGGKGGDDGESGREVSRNDGAMFSAFDFRGRNRRPPRDPVNALLSLAYSMLAKDCMLATLAVGFDPYIGFFHQPRHGRAALALDLMEEFRPLIADSAVLTAINNRMLEPSDFLRAGDAVNLTKTGRRRFFDCYEKRMNDNIRHPIFDYQVSYRRALELQARLLARALTGETAEYRALTTR
jgi:CRISPR-associated protein Cas1